MKCWGEGSVKCGERKDFSHSQFFQLGLLCATASSRKVETREVIRSALGVRDCDERGTENWRVLTTSIKNKE